MTPLPRVFPPPGDLPDVDPASVGVDPARLSEALAFAAAHPTPWPVDLRGKIAGGFFEAPPDNAILGPIEPRGEPNGLVLRGGRVVGRYGNTGRVDMTFSVAKSYLSLLAGIAFGDRLITDLDAPIGESVQDGGFEGRNAAITWRHLLQQTSEWEGTLFGKSDRIDRNRVLGQDNTGLPPRSTDRELGPPGSVWEYNDVRVNRLSLALLRLFRRPLPVVFAERIAGPIGLSSGWRWEGYDNAKVEIDGATIVSVPGGGHWGGGMFIDAADQARIALLAAGDGVWDGRRILPENWMAWSREPCPLNPDYGFMWWLNTGRSRYPSASEGAFAALGTGGNISFVEPADDLVIVVRWIDNPAFDGFVGRVRAAIRA